MLQSAEFSPLVLEERILTFIDDFYNKWLDPNNRDTFDSYLKSTLNRLKQRATAPETEVANLYHKLTYLSLDSKDAEQWNQKARNIESVKGITLESISKFYKNLFAPKTVSKLSSS